MFLRKNSTDMLSLLRTGQRLHSRVGAFALTMTLAANEDAACAMYAPFPCLVPATAERDPSCARPRLFSCPLGAAPRLLAMDAT
jgi:hypothetical protein